jgi:chromosome segregation ATPase
MGIVGGAAGGGGRNVTNTRTLSGGEKSYTTLCLLLALGRVTSVPFAIFDEIDVFMDDGAKFSLLLRTIVVT